MFSYVTLLIYIYYISYTVAVSPNMWGMLEVCAVL